MKQVTAHPPTLDAYPFFIHDSPDKFISKRIANTRIWEPFESHVLLSLLKPGDQVLDIGANIGWYTASSARRVAPTGRVFAFEPDPKNFRLLSANVASSDLRCVHVEQVALGRASGSAVMRHSVDNLGDHRVREFSATPEDAGGSGMVSVMSLDDYLEGCADFDIARLRIMKIDVQGFENEVLQGAQRLLANLPRRAYVFIEFDPVLLRECGYGAAESLLATFGLMDRFMFALARPIRRLKRVTLADLRLTCRSQSAASFDLILAHAEGLDDLRRALPMTPRMLSRGAFA